MRAVPALALVLALAGGPGAAALEVRFSTEAPRQGDALLMVVTGVGGAREATGSLGERSLLFFPHGGGMAALAGVDLETGAGELPWRVDVVDGGGGRRSAGGRLIVQARQFTVQHLTLPRHLVELDPETERRAVAESARLRATYETVTADRLWRGPFVRPLTGAGSGSGFGSRRVINGLPRMPHAGTDYAAERGTPVMAANRGRVALVGEFFFPGRFVALDHGLGLYTVYMHLDRIEAREGSLVERGEVIGTVGATGRATGPHLHFGAQLGRVRIDPTTLYALPLPD